MPLEKQVVSLELAQKLKELGVKQESYFSWVISQDKEKREIVQLRKTDIGIYNNPLYKMYHAYSVAELGEMLPVCTWSSKVVSTFGKYNCWRFKDGGGVTEKDTFYADTEADARAKMLIYLLVNNLIEV